MNLGVRDGKFDVVIAAGPRIAGWPSIGVRAVSSICANMGLTVGQFGGESINVKGVIPNPGTGGLVLVEDIQKRIHRIQARSVIRVSNDSEICDPFKGWYSQGLIPISTADRLLEECPGPANWAEPMTVILGTGNRALRFGSKLLELGATEVLCVETYAQWKAKRFAGWEVERRRFDMAGGKLIEAKPIQLIPKGPLLWNLRLQDAFGIRVLDVGRVISAGPFRDYLGVKEHPPGSFLFELEQSAATTRSQNVEGWVVEEERGKWLAAKIVKALVSDLGPRRDELDHIYRKARGRLKKSLRHREIPFTPSYQGKWISVVDAKGIRAFSGVPQQAYKFRPVASVECFEEIPCNICQTVCPTSAIQIGKIPRNKGPILNEAACTACGLCVAACPSSSISMFKEEETKSTSPLTLPWKGSKAWTLGEFAVLINRKGESLGSARVSGIIPKETSSETQLIQVDVPTHLIWEARSLRHRPNPATDDSYLAAVNRSSSDADKVEITLNGEKRWVRDRIPISLALFELGHNRSEDVLYCTDGTCGLCQIPVDGINKLACQTRIHRGMVVLVDPQAALAETDDLCPCMGISKKEIVERIQQGKLQSPEAVLSVTRVGEGKCHGQLCMGPFRRLLSSQGMDVNQWVDWRFPWSDWILTHN
ncbi:MAG: (2Fe-2S)-binding protein [Bdellovibrionia bacterium]